MLYTSYFGQLRNLPSTFIPVAICAKVPPWYNGICYKALAPSYDCLMYYKVTGDVGAYRKRYCSETLDKRSVDCMLKEIWELLPEDVKRALYSDVHHWTKSPLIHIVFVCYEKPDDFCHRDLVSDKLNSCGYECVEWHK